MTSRQYWAALAAVGAAALATPEAKADYYPVSWFMQHPAETNRMLAACQNNTGLAKQPGIFGANCENALQAHDARNEQSLAALLPAPLESVKHWQEAPDERRRMLATCRNILSSHTPMPADVAVQCSAAKAAGG